MTEWERVFFIVLGLIFTVGGIVIFIHAMRESYKPPFRRCACGHFSDDHTALVFDPSTRVYLRPCSKCGPIKCRNYSPDGWA